VISIKNCKNSYISFIENIPFSIIWADLNGTIIYSNSATERIFGYKRDELIGKNFIEITAYPKKFLSVFQEKHKKLLKGNPVEAVEIQAYKKDKSLIWASIQSSLIQIDKKPIIQVICQDITAKKQAELKLKESEEKFRVITEKALVGIGIIQNGKYVYVNEALSDISGYTTSELMNWSLKEQMNNIHPDDQGTVLKRLNKAIMNMEEQFSLSYRIFTKSGELKWLEIQAKLINFNKKLAILMIVNDISERKKVEEALKKSEKEKSAILEAMSDLVAYYDTPEMKIVWTNNAVAKASGVPINQIVGNYCYKVWHGSNEPCEYCPVIKTFQTGQSQEVESTTSNGKTWWIKAYPVKNENNKLLGVVEVTRDITERRNAEEALKRALTELKKLDRLKDEFYADLSHEIRTPLVAIKGFSELLLRSSNLDEIQRHDIEIILRNEDRLERLIHEMLDYSRLKSGKIFFKRDKIRVSKILQELKQELAPLIQEKQLIIEEYLNPDDELILDKHQITKVIRNLLTNAIKFSFPTGKITIKSNIHKGIWAFSVKDNGIGIPKNEIPHIFSRFVRLKNADMLQSTGIGLGLTICKKIIEAYNGKIWVESGGLNKGATSHFQLKLNG